MFHNQVRLEVRDTPKLPIPFYKGIYLGQLTLTLGHYADGWPVRKVKRIPSHRPTLPRARRHVAHGPVFRRFHSLLCMHCCTLYV